MSRYSLSRWAGSALLILLLSSCTMLGPDYQEPEVDVESEWLEATDPQLETTEALSPRWWQDAFHDETLNQLTATALQQNLSLRSAGLRVLQSRQQLAIAIGSQYPQQQQVTGNASRQRENSSTFNDYELGFNLAWEADFWGRFSRQIESASAALDASIADYDAVVVTLVSQTAQTYILIRTFQERVAVAQSNIKLQQESLRITEAKFGAGDVSELDVDQAKSLLYNTKATLSGLELSLQQLKNSLAVLLGKPPGEYNALVMHKASIPSSPSTIALGMPQDLIRRRPDLRAAERQLAAQSAQIGFAATDLYPHFSIGGSIGTQSMDSDELFDNNSETWDVFGMFQWNVLNYGRLQSNVRLQDARFQQLLVDYRNSVLQAQVDTENAIVAYLKSHEQAQSYQTAADAAQSAVDVATAQYQNGLVGFNTVISTLVALEAQQDLLALTQGDVANNLVQVYKTLGGGWEIRDNRDPVDLLPASTRETMRERTGAWEGILKE
jgi:NodT family efflux transporter outer membrane factor (OMF) lipoprotein